MERGAPDGGRERLAQFGAAAHEIVARQRTADAIEIGGNFASDISAIEIVEPGMGQVAERAGKGGLA